MSQCLLVHEPRGLQWTELPSWSSEVWSLGCIPFELAMLRNPFAEEGMNVYQLFCKISSGAIPPVSDMHSGPAARPCPAHAAAGPL